MKRFLCASLALLVAASASADWRMIVRLKTGATLADAHDSAASMGGSVVDSTPNAPFVLLSLPSDPYTYYNAQLQMALGFVDVLWSGDDVAMWNADAVSRGGSFGLVQMQDAVRLQNANALDQVNSTPSLADSDGRTVRIAILDNGLSRGQTALWSKVDASFDAFGGNADDMPMGRDTNGNGQQDGGVGHGTTVASLIDAVAPKVRLVIAKVADSDGRASAWSLVKGLVFAVNNGAEIANVSLGSDNPAPAVADAVSWARSKGLLVVAAIGNGGQDHAWYPSRDPLTLCVAGVGSDDRKAAFSNYDARATTCAPSVDIVGPSWDGSYARWSGTSFASPFVAAALADCLRRTTPKTPSEMIAAVASSGRNVNGLNDVAYQGKIGSVLNVGVLDATLRGAQ